jgi:hypothetical protein
MESLKDAIAGLKPYMQQRKKDYQKYVNILEILPSGESGYKTTKTLAELLAYIENEIAAKRKTETADIRFGLLYRPIKQLLDNLCISSGS